MHLDKTLKRAEILRLVAVGELERDAAQSLADDLGLGSLLPKPDLSLPLYDPLEEPRWTLLMAVTWVAFRRIELVQTYSNVVRAATGRWMQSGKGFTIAMEGPRWLHPIKSTSHDDEFASEFGSGASFIKGWQRLRQKLASGKVKGYARDLTRGLDADVALVPPENWNSLFICSAAGEDALRMRHSEAVRYLGIEIDREDLLAAFENTPEHGNVAANSTPTSSPVRGGVARMMDRVPKPDSPERAALTAYIIAEHAGIWPKMSDQRLIEAAHKWVKASPERRDKYPVSKMSKSVALKHPDRPARVK